MSRVAFLWDESFLWGLMAYKALNSNNIPFDFVRSEDINNGVLKNYKTLFVPGGWASNKIKILGDNGTKEIRSFVKEGGNYIGFCGGAGLATLDGIGLLNIKRRATKERVPSFSGRIQLNISDHHIWKGLSRSEDLEPGTRDSKPVFNAWWPSQFLVEDESIKVLATYGKAMPDSFSSDLNVGDVEANGNWSALEGVYKINLDPERLLGAPAVVGGLYGKGRVVLSLVHFDTPDDANGAAVLRNLWEYVGNQTARKLGSAEVRKERREETETMSSLSHSSLAVRASELPRFRAVPELESSVEELISLGSRNFLWFWRNPMLLQWRRGVRGLEYCTLYVMIKELAGLLSSQQSAFSLQHSEIKLDGIKKLLLPFVAKAKALLVMERLAMQKGHITYEKCEDPEIKKLRVELFSTSKSHGGLFKELIDETDKLLYALLSAD